MKEILSFLKELEQNNNKEWFDAHRPLYKAIQERIKVFTQQLIENISLWDESIKGIQPSDCLYRINRDLRFSKDKLPYKTHIGILIAKNGKKSLCGYYFHIEPHQSMLCMGAYMMENKFLKVIREDIVSRYDEFLASLQQAKDYELEMVNGLKRLPRGFEQNIDQAKYIMLKNYCLVRNIDESFLHNASDSLINGSLAKKVSDALSQTLEFSNFINRAIDFVSEHKGL
jgi:uncharacterized protein (TIGR02453 family)